jgi:hypothetical protein
MTDTIGTLETDLTVFATPTGSPGSYKGQTAGTTPLLATIKALLSDLAGLGTIGSAIATVNGDIATALADAATAIEKVADVLTTIEAQVPSGSSTAQVLQSLQNGLAVAQSLLPGSSPALTSGSQFFGTLSSLLTAVGNDVGKATDQLYEIGQQLTAIAGAF